MILLWLGLATLLQSSVTLFPDDLFAGAGWTHLAVVATFAAGLIHLTRRLRSVPVFGIHGQWLIGTSMLALILTQGGLPGHAGDIGAALGIDPVTRQVFAQLSQLLLTLGLWQALSNLARSKEQAVRALEAELHNAMTEMVIDVVERPRAPVGPRHTQSGLTPGLVHALEQVGPAHRTLRDLVMHEPNSIAARLALHNRLRNDDTQTGAFLLHGADFIGALRQASRLDLALNIAEECARQDAGYYPPVNDALVLARHAIAVDRHACALRLLKHFDVRNPAHPSIPLAFLLSAQALGGMGRNDTAQKLLGALVRHFPDDAVAADAIALSARLATRL